MTLSTVSRQDYVSTMNFVSTVVLATARERLVWARSAFFDGKNKTSKTSGPSTLDKTARREDYNFLYMKIKKKIAVK